jgi:hypothetical protein
MTTERQEALEEAALFAAQCYAVWTPDDVAEGIRNLKHLPPARARAAARDMVRVNVYRDYNPTLPTVPLLSFLVHTADDFVWQASLANEIHGPINGITVGPVHAAFPPGGAPHCPMCGYTAEDALRHGDHGLCKGTIPTEPTPLEQAVDYLDQAELPCHVCGIERLHHGSHGGTPPLHPYVEPPSERPPCHTCGRPYRGHCDGGGEPFHSYRAPPPDRPAHGTLLARVQQLIADTADAGESDLVSAHALVCELEGWVEDQHDRPAQGNVASPTHDQEDPAPRAKPTQPTDGAE